MGLLKDFLDEVTDTENIPVDLDIAHMIVVGLEMFTIGPAPLEGTAVGGLIEVAGIVLPVAVWVASVYEFDIGLRKKAKKDAAERGYARGYAIGMTAAAIGMPGSHVKAHFWMNSAATGFTGDTELAEIARNAHNLGLVVGYKEASELNAGDKKKLQRLLVQNHHKLLTSQGREFRDPGNDADRVLMWAGAFLRVVLGVK